MPSIAGTIVDGRPIITAAFHISQPRWFAMHQTGQDWPSPFIGRALIDTGATDSCVDPAVTVELGLEPRGTTRVHTASTAGDPHSVAMVDLSIILLPTKEGHPLLLPAITAMEIEILRSQGIHALIGQDVLAQCILVQTGPEQRFELSWA